MSAAAESVGEMAQVGERAENVRVCVRFRPVNAREQRASRVTAGGGNAEDVDLELAEQVVPWSWNDKSVLPLFPITRGERSRLRVQERYGEAAGGGGQDAASQFHFDRVFGCEDTNDALYDEMMADLVQSAMEGKHCAAFAFGQTSTGKTYTMQGTSERPGVIPRAVHDVFAFVHKHADREFLLRVSYLEIYNESINDLFEPSSTNLKVFEDRREGPKIQGLEEKIVVAPEQVFALLSAGEAQRHIGCTDYNKQSSRSHTIFRIVIESRAKPRVAEGDAATATAAPEPAASRPARVATLNLVDLAGSESAQTVQSRARRQEGSAINKSLLSLTHIIFKLSERAQKGDSAPLHIPYRDSKLTRILQKALQGNSRISIVCTVTPWAGAQEETLNTLRFATRAKRVKRSVHVNEVLDERALLLKYKQEIAVLRRKLADAERKSAAAPGNQAGGGSGLTGDKRTQAERDRGEDEDGSDKEEEEEEEEEEEDDDRVPAGSAGADPKLRAQIDEAIRNLNRVILNSGGSLTGDGGQSLLPDASGGSQDAADGASDGLLDEESVSGSTAKMAALRARAGSPTDQSTPFFRRLSSFDHQLEKHEYHDPSSLQRARSQSHVQKGEAKPPALLNERQHRAKSAQDIGQLLVPSVTAAGGSSATPAKRSSITTELRSIREQLSTLLQDASASGNGGTTPPRAPAPAQVQPGGLDEETQRPDREYVEKLEARVRHLENEVERHALQQSVSKADRSFLERLLEEKDATLSEWGDAIHQIEEKQQQLEEENARLRAMLEAAGMSP